MEITRDIFRAYDIRGTVGDQITPEVFYTIARAYASHFEKPSETTIVVGRDLRESSEMLQDSVTEGLVDSGCHVIDIGQVPTPLLYFAIGHWNADGGLAVTASHKPPEFNGMKLREGEWPFFGDDLQRLYEQAVKGNFPSGSGHCEKRDIYPDYFQIAADRLDLQRPVKVVLDVGNGAATLTAPRLLEDIGADVDAMFTDPDGTFPNRPPDPLKIENIAALARRVQETDAELGIAIDADGDRVAVVDDCGEMIWPDAYVLPICHRILDQGSATFVTEVRCSQSLIDDVQSRGGTMEMRACGYPYILDGMRETGAAMGFETTGHCYFADPYIKFDDASLAAGKLLEALSALDRNIRQIVGDAPTYYTADEQRMDCPDEYKFEVADRVAEMYSNHEMLTVDGARILFDDGWALIRASNTGAELVMRWEADTPEGRDRIGQELLERVRRARDTLMKD